MEPEYNGTGSSKVRAGSSITDELRKYARNYERMEALSIELLAIADRIDERHAKARDKAYDEGVNDGIDADKNAMGYIKLPMDADGVPIHVGDTIKIEHNGRVTTVANINYNEHGWQVYCSEGGGFDKDTRCRHVQPDTWERIIEDALLESHWEEPSPDDGDYERCKRVRDMVISELVERCRRLADGD